MAVTPTRVTVTSTATRIDVGVESDVHQGAGDFAQRMGQHLIARNRDAANSVFVGDQNVTTTTGFELLPGESIEADLLAGDALYGCCAATKTALCHVLQTGL